MLGSLPHLTPQRGLDLRHTFLFIMSVCHCLTMIYTLSTCMWCPSTDLCTPDTGLRIHWTSSGILILSPNYLWNHPIVSFYLWKLNSRVEGDLLIIWKWANIRAQITKYAPSLITHLVRGRAGTVESGVTNPPFLAICLTFLLKVWLLYCIAGNVSFPQ